MLECFFSNRYAKRGDLFEGLSIWEKEEYRNLQGAYPVIFLSFANVKGMTYQDARDGIIRAVFGAFRDHDDLFLGRDADKAQREYYGALENYVSNPSKDRFLPDDFVTGALHELTVYLHRHYGKRALLFLDEYDTPLQEAYVKGYWKELVALVRSMFNAAFKTNPSMERGILTGITRVSRESVFSDLNNLTVITTTSEKYRTQFGFVQEEVWDALELFGIHQEKENVKAWYDGFTFGSQKDIYNPWSITGFLEERLYKPYWANSSSNSLVSNLIRQGNPQTKMMMEDLLAGKTLKMELDEEIIFDQLGKKPGAVWSMLLAAGYLKVTDKAFCQETGIFTYGLQLTNREVAVMFRDMIKGWFSDEDVPYNEFVRALLLGDTKAMNRYMNRVALETFSFFDTGKRPSKDLRPERFYHGFVLGLIVELAGRYRILSNRESGFGRYDVMLEPLGQSDMAFVLEFKVFDPDEEETLADTLKAAHLQMEKKAYDTELAARGILGSRIRHYGFAFVGKTVLIG